MILSFFICVLTSGLSYILLRQDKYIVNIFMVSFVYGFVSYIIFTLIKTQYEESIYVNEIFISMVYMVVMYKSNLTDMLTKKDS